MSNPLNGAANGLKKTVSALTSVATVLSLSGAAYLAPMAAVAAVPSDYGLREGDTISAAGTNDPDVYIVNAQGYKRLFLNPVIFSFYGHLGGFSKVKTVSATARDAFPTSGLFRNCEANEQAVWAVEVNGEDTAVLHHVNMSGSQAVAEDANFFKKVFCINNNEAAWYTKSSVAYTSLSQVPVYARVPGQTPTPTGSLSASLAADNPAAGTVLETQSLADLAHFNVNGSGTVTSVELTRLGVSGDSTVSDVYLFVNGVRVSDAGNISSGKVTFSNGNGLFTAPATVSVRATIADSTSGQTLGFSISKVNGNAVSASGNLFTIATDPSTLAALSIGAATGPGNFDPQNDVNVWQASFTVTNEDVWLKRLTIREIGSVNNSDVKNLRLFVDGVQVGSDADLDAEGYATILTNTELKSGTRTVKIVADVVGGSTRTMEFSLRGYYDVDAVSEGYGVGVKASNTFPRTVATASTIGSPSVTVIKASNSPSGDVVDEASDVVLGRFSLTAFGEQVKIETLTFRASVSDLDIDNLRNGRVLINGTQYGSTATLATTGLLTTASTSFTVNYTLQPGTTVTVEVRADLAETTADSVSADDVVSVLMDGGSDNNNAQGITSANTLDVPGTTVESNNQTVKSGSMTVAKYTAYANQNVVVPNSSLKLGHFVMTGGSAEDVNINTLNVGFTGADQWAASNLSNVYVKILNSSGGLVLQTSPKATVTGSNADNAYSVNFTLPKSTTYQAEVWGAVSSFTVAGSNDTMITSLDTSGTSAQSSATVTGSEATGQTLTAATGSIASAVSGANPAAKIVASNSTSSAAAFDFTATSDNFTIYELVFDMDNGSTAAATVANVVVKDGSTVIASAPLNGASVSFTGLNVTVPNNDTKTLTVDLQFGTIGVGAASSAADAKLNLESFKARDSVGNITTSTTERQGNSIYPHRSYPGISAVGLPSSVLVAGEVTMSKFNLTANNNTVGVKKIVWDISKSSDAVLASAAASAKLLIDGVDSTSLGAFTSAGIGNGQTTGTITFIFTNEYQVSGATSKVFELKNTVSSLGSTGSVVAQLKTDTAFAVPNTYSVVAATGANLVWTDRSASSHGESTADWMNDNLILSAISQALSK